jgi:hypothetical protein
MRVWGGARATGVIALVSPITGQRPTMNLGEAPPPSPLLLCQFLGLGSGDVFWTQNGKVEVFCIAAARPSEDTLHAAPLM